MKLATAVSLILSVAWTGGVPCFAEVLPTAQPSLRPAENKVSSAPVRKPKGKHPREKETEGTEARDRFQADTVIKSKYELNGSPLEVDPD